MMNKLLQMLTAIASLVGAFLLLLPVSGNGQIEPSGFQVVETSISQIHGAYADGSLTARELVQRYLDRIEAYDQNGPRINAFITLNGEALEDADRLDAAFRASGLVGPLHGIPVVLKDQVDVAGMPTTLGSILFENYYPDRHAFVTERLLEAGAIILGKVTLGELAGGDTHGSLFGSTRNPYALDRTVGGSSGGSAASVAANFATIAVAQEGLASIRRPAAWNSIVGIRPTAGLVSRGGVFAGWPQLAGTLGPMARTVEDLAVLLDVMVGYDPEDPITAHGREHIPETYRSYLDAAGLEGARLGVLRESIGIASEPDSEDFAKVDEVFEQTLAELRAAGAVVVDPIEIPDLKERMSFPVLAPGEAEESFQEYFGRSAESPFASLDEMVAAPGFREASDFAQRRFPVVESRDRHYEYLVARDEIMTQLLKVMSDHELDAIVYKAVEHQPTLIEDGVNPPFVNTKGVPYLNTFLVYVPAIVVPAGFTVDDLPVGITFMGRPYEDGEMLRLAYAYEQATRHRRPADTVPELSED
ncbi:MAG TPA: amidase family protein [Gammaproteobacteria bacterium]